jgi:hypothetical protein
MALDFEKIQDSPHLLDILIQMEDILDSFDVYVFANWINGEIVEGPKVRRYWFDMTLRYEMKKMPDPKGALRLIKHGVRVSYDKATLESDQGEDPGKATHWEVKLSIPRRLLSDMNAGELDYYDDEIEAEDVQDAQDEGMNDETGFVEDGESNQADPDASGDDEEADPDAPF